MLPTHKPYVIGETAFHHEGDVAFLKELVEAAKSCQLDAIKFHLLLDLDDYMVHNHQAIEVLRPWCLTANQWDQVLETTDGLDVVFLCNDVESVQYANNRSNQIKAIEIHATGINDVFLLAAAAQFPHTVIIGTGGSSLDEIDFAIQFLREKGKTAIFLMHGFQSYPTDFKDIKLERMKKLAALFQLPVGYADHTDPAEPMNAYISCLGVANGFNVIEKHFTTKFGEKRIDAQSAVSLEQMEQIVHLAHATWAALGLTEPLVLSKAESAYGNTGPMKKAIVARNAIEKGEVISLENIAFKRTNESSSIKQLELMKLLGNKALKAIQKDEIIDLSNVDFEFKATDFSQFNNTSK